jgi:hypothetical protein
MLNNLFSISNNIINWKCPLNRGLLSWWLILPQFTSSAKLVDLNNIRNGKIIGSKFSRVSHPQGFGSLSLNGSSDYIDMGDFIGPTNGFSFFLWIYHNSINTVESVSAVYNGINAYFQFFRLSDNKYYARIQQVIDTIYIGRACPPILQGWNHIGFIWDGGITNSSIKIYQNGKQVDNEDNGIGVFTNSNTAPTTFNIGAQAGIALINASIDDIKIYNRGLSDIEVKNLYQESLTGYKNSLNWSENNYYYFILQNMYAKIKGNNNFSVWSGPYLQGVE